MTVDVLCVGHGPSYNDYNFIKKFDGKILSVDVSTTDLIDNGIIPDYMTYAETGHTVIRDLHTFMPEEYFRRKEVRDKITIVYKKDKMTYIFIDRVRKYDLEEFHFHGIYGAGRNHRAQAVGLYTIAFADKILNADKIHLIGFDYKGLDNSGVDMCDTWIEKTIHYLKSRRNYGSTGVIIDHSKGDFPI